MVAVSLAQAAPLPVTDSAVSVGSMDNTIGAARASWDSSRPSDWLVAWIKLPAGADMVSGQVRYQYKVTYTSPDKTGTVSEGPFNFDSVGYAKASKPISFFDNIKTGFSPKPNEGKWQIGFTMVDKQNGNQEEPGALLAFYLTGSDEAQKPVAATTTTSTSTTTISLSIPAMAAPLKSTGTSEVKKAKKKKAKKRHLGTRGQGLGTGEAKSVTR